MKRKIWNIVSRKTKMKCLAMIFLSVVAALAASLWPVQLGNLYTDISDGHISGLQQGIRAVLLFGATYAAAEGIAIFRRVAVDRIAAGSEKEVREESFSKLLQMPVKYYADSVSGTKTAELNQGVTGLSQLIRIFCNDITATLFIAVCTLGQVVANAPSAFVIIMISYLALSMILSVLQIRSQNGIREAIVEKKNNLDGKICQSILNLELIRCMDANKYEERRMEPVMEDICSTEKRHHMYMGAFDMLKQLCKVAFQAGIILYALFLISKGAMNPGVIITVCLLFQQLIKPIDEIYRFLDETASSFTKCKALTELFGESSDLTFRIQPSEKPESGHIIEIRDVDILSPAGIPIASYDRIEIDGRKKTAIRGESGCGKTTLIRCLTRYYGCDRTKGAVRIFGRDLYEYSSEELAGTICYVPQMTYIFAGTIRDNLVYGLSEDFSGHDLIGALERACLYDDLVSSVKKQNCSLAERDRYDESVVNSVLEMSVIEGGNNLSGGMRQRLSLARVFLRKPKLFIFDESTANLDEITGNTVLRNVETYAEGIGAGIVYIAHNENVVKRCDEVIELENRIYQNRRTEPQKCIA